MLRSTFLGIALVALLAPLASAQTVDEIVAKYVAARGGMEKLKAVSTMRATGRMTMGPGLEAPMVLETRRPNQMRMEFTLQGMTGTQAYDGKAGWMVMPFMGKKDPEAMSAEDTREMDDESDFDGPLVDYKAKGNKVELLGKESVEGADAYKLKITLKSGKERIVYLDADSYLEIRSETKRTVRGTETEFETSIGDYKSVNGLMFPFSQEIGVKGGTQKQRITIDSLEVNPPLEAMRFTMPEVKADSAKVDSAKAAAAKAETKPAGEKATEAKPADAKTAGAKKAEAKKTGLKKPEASTTGKP